MRAGPVSAAALRVLPAVTDRRLLPAGPLRRGRIRGVRGRRCRSARTFRRQRLQSPAPLRPPLARPAATWFVRSLGRARRPARLRGSPDAAPPRLLRGPAATSTTSGCTDRTRLDYDWLLALGDLRRLQVSRGQLGIDLGIDAAQPRRPSARASTPPRPGMAMQWTLSGASPCTPASATPPRLGADHIDELLAAVRRFGERPDIGAFYGRRPRATGPSPSQGLDHPSPPAAAWCSTTAARSPSSRASCMPGLRRPAATAAGHGGGRRPLAGPAAADRPRPSRSHHLGLALRRFLDWLAGADPEHRQLRPGHPRPRPRLPRGHGARCPTRAPAGRWPALTRRARTSAFGLFFRETAALGVGRRARPPAARPPATPRVRCSRAALHPGRRAGPADGGHRRPWTARTSSAALLVARWSGARRGEIQRLALDCLDHYPDGTGAPAPPRRQDLPRARRPAARGRRRGAAGRRRPARRRRSSAPSPTSSPARRALPVHAATASCCPRTTCSTTPAAAEPARPRPAWCDARRAAATVTAHRFRHTVGTQLAERGAKLHTIMRVLGHTRVRPWRWSTPASATPRCCATTRPCSAPARSSPGPGAEAVRAGTLPAERGRVAEDQLLQDRAGARPLPAPAGRRGRASATCT